MLLGASSTEQLMENIGAIQVSRSQQDTYINRALHSRDDADAEDFANSNGTRTM